MLSENFALILSKEGVLPSEDVRTISERCSLQPIIISTRENKMLNEAKLLARLLGAQHRTIADSRSFGHALHDSVFTVTDIPEAAVSSLILGKVCFLDIESRGCAKLIAKLLTLGIPRGAAIPYSKGRLENIRENLTRGAVFDKTVIELIKKRLGLQR